jgi:hypothetical protein
MKPLEILLIIGGILHFGTLLGSAQVPRELRFREELPKLPPLMRHWILVAGGYVVLCILGFGTISLCMPSHLASGEPLARAICGFIALFWSLRLMIQFFLFDARPYLRNWFLRVGYHGLTVVFLYHTVVYGAAALWRS